MILKSPKEAIKPKMLLLSDDKSRCLILIERIVYPEKKFSMSL